MDTAAIIPITLKNGCKTKLTGKVDKSGTPFSVMAGVGAFTLTHNQTRTVLLKFAPTAVAASSGSITIRSNDPFNGAVQVGISGTGVSGTLALSPPALNFPTKKVHKSASLKLTIKNTGLGVLHGSIDAAGELTAPFSALGAGKFTLAESKSRVVTVTFAPKTAGTFTGAIRVNSDDSAQAGVPVSVSVMGTGQ
ncbi:MAG: choice-of-anchor D domain-containing protein [Candidatus Binatales bacterium]